MMGVGKSTIGKSLATKLSYAFIDVDRLIEKKEGKKINVIFRNKGESFFRKLENDISLDNLKSNNCVVSLGGGAFLNKSIRRAVKNSAVSFWLDVNVDELVRRLKRTRKRPLLLGKSLNETINKIYLERKKTYNEADFRIRCSFLSHEKIVNKIYSLYESSKNKI